MVQTYIIVLKKIEIVDDKGYKLKLVRLIVGVVKPCEKQEVWFAFKLIKYATLKYLQKRVYM